MTKKVQNIHEMNLGDESHLGPWDVYRVPGGWIFLGGGPNGVTATFVPYSVEFKQYDFS